MDVRLVRSRIAVLGLACGMLLRAPGRPCSAGRWDRVSRVSGGPRGLAGTLSRRFVWSLFAPVRSLHGHTSLQGLLTLLKLRSAFPPCDPKGRGRLLASPYSLTILPSSFSFWRDPRMSSAGTESSADAELTLSSPL